MSTINSRLEAAPAQRRSSFWRTPGVLASLCVTLTVLLANAIFLTGLRTNDPKTYYTGLGSPRPGSIRGGWTIDPNVGWTVEALGRAAARSWARGHVPLWNSFEGLGQPLAGEMQSAALFQPFIMLQLLPHGVFAMHLVLELIAGLTTVFFLRRLNLGWIAATTGGCLFAVNGAFAVMTNAPFNPIAFLPMGLLGVEMILARVRTPRRRPWGGLAVLALAIGWMLLAGFPETAFLEGLFIGCWTLVRLLQVRGRRGAFAGWTFAGLLLGLALASPVLVAFADFMSWGSTSYHEDVANDISYAPRQMMSLAMPYAVGALNTPVMKLQAGYLTLPALLLALVGLTSARRRGIRLLLTLTIVVLLGNMFRFVPIKALLNHTPGIKAILVYKYGVSILEFAVVIAAAIGLDDLAQRRVGRLRALGCTAAVAFYAGVSLVVLDRQGYLTNPRWTLLVVVPLALALVALLRLLLRARPGQSAERAYTQDAREAQAGGDVRFPAAVRHPSGGATAAAGTSLGPAARRGASALLAGTLLVLTAAAHFAVPQAGASKPPVKTLDTAPVTFLQKNLGTARFYTLGPIQPDYGSYWGIGQLNVNDLPVPKEYGRFVLDELRPSAPAAGLTAKQRDDAFKDYQLIAFNPPAAVQRKLLAGYGEKQQAFRDAGVRYLVTRPDVVSPAKAAELGLHKVLDSPKTDIFEDSHAARYYSAGRGCTFEDESRTHVTVTCPTASTLTRRELDAPGWHATLNGARHDMTAHEGQLYQRLDIPAGTSHITFDYRPRHFALAATASLLALLITLAAFGGALFGRRGDRRAPSLTHHEQPTVAGHDTPTPHAPERA